MKHNSYLLCVLVSFLVMSQGALAFPYTGDEPESSEYSYSEEPLVAYNVTTIPAIDGIISVGEWNDTAEYVYERKYIEGSISELTCRIKHNSQWLYILFTVEHSIKRAYPAYYLGIGLDTYKDAGVSPYDDRVHTMLIGTTENTTWFTTVIDSNDIQWWENNRSATNSSVDFSHIDDYSYLYEMAVPLSYFNTTDRLISFNIQCGEYMSWHARLGRSLSLGMILSDSYWYEETETKSLNWIPYVALSVVVSVCSSGITFAYMRKRSKNG